MLECKLMSEAEYFAAWERARRMQSKTLFHEPAWLEYLVKTGKGAPRFLQLVPKNSDLAVAYHVFLEVRVGPFKVMGSPLPGWTTNYMGPLFDGADQQHIIEAIKRFALRAGYIYVELKNQSLDPTVMRSMKFDHRADVTAVLTLSPDPETVWRTLSGNARNRIKKAEAAGLRAELTDDRTMIEEYYEMIVRRYAAQSLAFPFQIDRLYALWDCLKPHRRLLTVRVLKETQTVACGLFPFDENAVYYFGGASLAECNKYCPNELMHWTVMKEAGARGVREYDMCGTSRFKRKFGTRDVAFVSYGYSPIPGLLRLRNLLLALHWKRLRWTHKLRERLGLRNVAAPSDAGED